MFKPHLIDRWSSFAWAIKKEKEKKKPKPSITKLYSSTRVDWNGAEIWDSLPWFEVLTIRNALLLMHARTWSYKYIKWTAESVPVQSIDTEEEEI